MLSTLHHIHAEVQIGFKNVWYSVCGGESYFTFEVEVKNNCNSAIPINFTVNYTEGRAHSEYTCKLWHILIGSFFNCRRGRLHWTGHCATTANARQQECPVQYHHYWWLCDRRGWDSHTPATYKTKASYHHLWDWPSCGNHHWWWYSWVRSNLLGMKVEIGENGDCENVFCDLTVFDWDVSFILFVYSVCSLWVAWGI